MKKFVVMLLSTVLVCSLAACGKTEEKKISTVENTASVKDSVVNVDDIGTPDELVVDENTGEVLNEWVPVAGRTGAFIDVFEGIDSDNARAIIEYASAADEAGYNVYILLGTKTEENSMSYAFVGEAKTEKHATSAKNDLIIIVKASNDGSITVTEFNGTREDITEPGEVETDISSDEPTDKTVEDVNENVSTEE